MSKLIKKINGRVEVAGITQAPTKREDTLNVSEFWGGSTRGPSIQLGCPLRVDHFQLDTQGVAELIFVLSKWMQGQKLSKETIEYVQRTGRIIRAKQDHLEKAADYIEDDTISDPSNDFKAMKHRSKQRKSKNVFIFVEQIKPDLERRSLKVTEFNTNSFRITDEVKTVDYYPATKKIFVKHLATQWRVIKAVQANRIITDILHYLT